jgi:cysteine sulfinate desulfinase/cysteine desulfurase-like protein
LDDIPAEWFRNFTRPGESRIRFGLGRFNNEEEVDYVAERLVYVVKKLRELELT